MVSARSFAVSVLAAALVVLSACGSRGEAAGGDASFHPGEADAALSEEIRSFVSDCAMDQGWHLGDLELLVDDDGLLIRMAYRSRNIFPGTTERDAVDACLERAGVTSPPDAA